MSSFNIALIGGGIISRAHIAAAKNSGTRVCIVASADPSEDARKALADATGGAPVFASAGELFEQKLKIDGIVVCTPPSVRFEVVEPALQRGIAVLVEKPLAHTLSDARRLAELAARFPKVASSIGYCHRFVPAVEQIKRRLDAGELGELVRVENVFASYFPAMRQRWMSDPKLSGGGALIDTGCHSLDLFQYLAGDAKVIGAVFQRPWTDRGESSATVLVKSGSAAGVIESGWLEPARFTLQVVGTGGMLLYDYDRPTDLRFRPVQGAEQVIAVPSHEVRFERQLLAFASFAQGGERGRLAGFEQGLVVAELVDAAQDMSII